MNEGKHEHSAGNGDVKEKFDDKLAKEVTEKEKEHLSDIKDVLEHHEELQEIPIAAKEDKENIPTDDKEEAKEEKEAKLPESSEDPAKDGLDEEKLAPVVPTRAERKKDERKVSIKDAPTEESTSPRPEEHTEKKVIEPEEGKLTLYTETFVEEEEIFTEKHLEGIQEQNESPEPPLSADLPDDESTTEDGKKKKKAKVSRFQSFQNKNDDEKQKEKDKGRRASTGWNMSDLFNKHIKKATARTKERLLEGIGKANKTQDEAFDFHAANLIKQSKAYERLHKDLKAYAVALKASNDAEKTLRESIRLAYEPEWPDREHVVSLTNSLDIQTDELEKKICEDLTASVAHYVAQFAELKKKIDKRGRKLVDYDSAKNNFNSAKASSKKGDADPKITKAHNELQQAETLYKEINSELLEILPATYDSRITFLADTLQTLFNTQSTHQTESSKLHKSLVTQLDQLGTSLESLRVPRPEAASISPVHSESPTPQSEEVTRPSPQPSPVAPPTSSDKKDEKNPFDEDEDNKEEKCSAALYPKLNAAPPAKDDQANDDEKKKEKDTTNPFDTDEDEEVEKLEIPLKDRKVLYTVRATHDYKAVDTDELSFAANELITVLESKDEDQLDDGWLLGRKADGNSGVFPENFTKKE